MLVARNLRKVYSVKEKRRWFQKGTIRQHTAVQDVSLEVNPGEIVGLLGINGAGKTTTIKMLTTLLAPTSGTIMVDEIDAVKEPLEVKKIVNMITGGERNIYWRLTARENLEYFGALYNISPRELKKQIATSLHLVGLTTAADQPVEQFSKGMKQRLQIARGLINNPKYLFLDEPTLGLDVAIAKEMRRHVRDLAKEQGKGIILTTHYISEVEELCDRVFVLDHGRVIASGTTYELARSTKKNIELVITVPEVTAEVEKAIRETAAANVGSALIETHEANVTMHLSSKQNMTEQIVRILVNENVPILNLSMPEPSLEEALLEMASGREENESFVANR